MTTIWERTIFTAKARRTQRIKGRMQDLQPCLESVN